MGNSEDTLDSGLPQTYTPEMYQNKCSAVFEHIYEVLPRAKRRDLRQLLATSARPGQSGVGGP